ncbi:MAG TPA: hypothetical protein V6D08_02380 [Candidatus Obscuribacterales bacterium]
MAEKFEFNQQAIRNTESSENALINEGIEMSHLRGGAQDKGMEKSEAFEAAVSEMAERLASIAARVASLPEDVKASFLHSISGMTGDKFPAYDLLRTNLAKGA